MSSCDIIMPVWNQLAFTRDCIDSVLRNTDLDYRLIIIDNASDDKTKVYLEGLKNNNAPLVLAIRNDKNLGFVKAVNQGLRVSDAAYICIMNNDTLVTKNWLNEMIEIARSSKDIGIVNPSSNNLGQKPLASEPMELYASKMRRESGKFVELGAALGFCMLIKREVIDGIGLFDEIYGMGNFEDTDFCRRAIKAQYRCVRACGAYVYHRESSSFNQLKTFKEDFKRNREIYEFRWGRPKRLAYILDRYDDNILKKLQSESLRSARDGNWVWYFFKEREEPDLPEHSNIVSIKLPLKNFRFVALLKILTKKKRFDQIFVGDEKFGNVLERLSFIHKAKIRYY